MRIILKIIVLISLTAYLIFAVVHLAHPQENEPCRAVNYIISYEGEEPPRSIVDQAFVAHLLKEHRVRPVGKALGAVNLRSIRNMLNENPYIDSAYCYYTAAGTLCIGVIPKRPVMQVVTPTKKYFLTDKGSAMPMKQYDLKLPQVSGEVSVKEARKLRPLLDYIAHSRWHNKVENYRIDPKHGLVMTMKDEPFDVILGSEEDYERKLTNLDFFMQTALPKAGKERYSCINLSFEDQVVAVKNKRKKHN
jgi:cell division protein FtsQ